MDLIDALWYGAVTPGEVLEKQDEKQLALTRLIERNRAELAALHPEAGAILEKLAGNQAELRQLAVLGQEYGFLAALEMTKKESPAGLPQRLPPGHTAGRRSPVESAGAL